MSAAASLGLILQWDVETGFSTIDKVVDCKGEVLGLNSARSIPFLLKTTSKPVHCLAQVTVGGAEGPRAHAAGFARLDQLWCHQRHGRCTWLAC